MANRMSTYSTGSLGLRGGLPSTQVSTTTLLNALHAAYTTSQPYYLDASTSLVVNTWLTAETSGFGVQGGGTVDVKLAQRAWEHARRRAEDGCILLSALHHSTPSLLSPFISALPLSVPASLYTALSALRPFICSVSPENHSTPRYTSLAASFNITLTGKVTGASLALSSAGLDTNTGLLHVPGQAGYRAFDVFYYLLTSASTPAEREFLSLKPPSSYSLLNRSGTYDPPKYIPSADDAAAAEDFRTSLKNIGIKGSAHRGLLSVLAGLLKLGETLGFLVDEDILEEVCEDVAGLLGIDPEVLVRKCSTEERDIIISGIYHALVDWVISKANESIAAELGGSHDLSSNVSASGGRITPNTEEEDTVSITVVEVPSQSLGKALAFRGVSDDSTGINAEMIADGVQVSPVGSSITTELRNAMSEAEATTDLGVEGVPASRQRELARDRMEGILEKVGMETEDGSFLKQILYPRGIDGVNVGKLGRMDVSSVLASTRVWYHLSLHPTDDSPPALVSLPSTTSAWSAGTVSRQLRSWRLPEWANRRNRNLDYTSDFDIEEFCTRYSVLGCKDGRDGVESWVMERGWSNGEVVVGHERIWMRESAWWEAETMLDMKATEMPTYNPNPFMGGGETPNASGFFGGQPDLTPTGSRDNLLQRHQSSATLGMQSKMGAPGALGARSIAPTMGARTISGGDYGLGFKGDAKKPTMVFDEDLGRYTLMDPEIGVPKAVEERTMGTKRRLWVGLTWALTFWIPSFMLRYIGRMKRPDVRMAWREKVVLMMIIAFLNCLIVFWIVALGNILCPNYNKVWNNQEVSYHQGENDFYVNIHGKVYDITKFWRLQHSDTSIQTTSSVMLPFAGMNLDDYFPPPLTIACPALVTNQDIVLQDNTTVLYPNGVHNSGPYSQPVTTTALHNINWYTQTFEPRIKEYYKGYLVTKKSTVQQQGTDYNRYWAIIDDNIYDLTNYFYTLKMMDNIDSYSFLDPTVESLFQNNPGQDISEQWHSSLNATAQANNLQCLTNAFYVGKPDFRDSARCQVNNYLLLAFSITLCCVILIKFLSALQLGSKPRPSPQDKFVICQVPAYTEGEEQLRKGLDSLTALQYDNKRKLICVVCDGMIVGGGNDRPTPKIVLDILGVDPKIDPPALPFKSVGEGSEQLNYGKVYSGLYEYEGNVVPYLVIVKVGKESEQSKAKPGNRGKRDSQILLLSFLNRVHHRSPMSPLELEIFHQINNIIGVDPELYEYLLMVDADTSVREDSLNRLVARCANDAKIAGICGETSLENEEGSWWTMIQVYEYYISHHLAKAFESLFGSVTCLPGCFCMYRLRTADKGRPLIISDKILEEYSVGTVDTLHKKNLLSLGEDRYLTTLMTKHFPYMSYKFIPDAYALTAAPETWSVLLSQRRRWINSTIHNLGELMFLPEMCGFCCFSMRFVVFIDLFGTIILPATCCYLGYLIYRVASHSGQFPLISIIMLAAVYGLQALIFIIKRQWQHVGWMIIYLLAFPIYSFVLPVYSFWNQDNFTWGNTRIVIGEKGHKQVVAVGDDHFDPRSIPLQRWDDYAMANNLPGRRGGAPYSEKEFGPGYGENGYEMEDMRSVYSSAKPASTILTGFPGAHQPAPPYMPPQSPAAFNRQTVYSNMTHSPSFGPHDRLMSVGNLSDHYQDHPSRPGMPQQYSSDNLTAQLGGQTPLMGQQYNRSPYGGSRPVSTIDFRTPPGIGPDESAIVESVRSVLAEVDLDNVTKKQVRALVEQRLQSEIVGEKRAFLDRQIDTELANM